MTYKNYLKLVRNNEARTLIKKTKLDRKKEVMNRIKERTNCRLIQSIFLSKANNCPKFSRNSNTLSKQQVSEELQQEFEHNGIMLSMDFEVRTITLNQCWIIRNNKALYEITSGNKGLNVTLKRYSIK